MEYTSADNEQVLLSYLQKNYHCEKFEIVTIKPTATRAEIFDLAYAVADANNANFRKSENNFCRFWIGLKAFRHGGGEDVEWKNSGLKVSI